MIWFSTLTLGTLRLNRKSVNYFCALIFVPFIRDAGDTIFLSFFRISNLIEKTEVFSQALITDNADNQVNYIELPQV